MSNAIGYDAMRDVILLTVVVLFMIIEYLVVGKIDKLFVGNYKEFHCDEDDGN